MTMSRNEMKDDLKMKAEHLKQKVHEVFGDHVKDIDFSCIDLFSVLYFNEMRYEVEDPGWAVRDRLVVSNLKVIPSLLAVLAQVGYINWKECHDMVLNLPRLFSNPNLAIVSYPGVDFITDSPYLGMIFSIGSAMAGRQNRQEYRVFHVVSDRRSTVLQQAMMTASSAKLGNLTSIIPYVEANKRSTSMHFWFSMGWHLEEIRFDDFNSIFEGFWRSSRSKGKPQVLLG